MVENRKRSLAHSSDDEVGSGGIVGRILNSENIGFYTMHMQQQLKCTMIQYHTFFELLDI